MPSPFVQDIVTPARGHPIDSSSVVTLGERFYFRDGSDKERLGRYLRGEDLLDVDKHEQLLQDSPRHPECDHYIAVDFPGMFARLIRHYTFGAEFEVDAVTSGMQSEIDRVTRASRLALTLREAAEMGPVLGDLVFRVDLLDRPTTSGEEAVVRFVKPHNYFPEIDPLDSRNATEATLAFVLDGEEVSGVAAVPGGGAGDRLVVLREIHRPGEREFVLSRWSTDGKLGDEVPLDSHPATSGLPASESTGIDEIPVIHVAFGRRAGETWGNGIMDRIEPLLGALERRLTQEDEVLEKHARPKLIVGPGVLDDKGRASLKDFDIIEVDPSILEKAVKPEYLTWDMQVEGIRHAIEKIEEYLFMTTETSPASFGLERDGSQVESARALRFKAHRTVNLVEDFRVCFEEGLRDMFRIAQKLNGVEDPTEIRVSWPDPIIEDDAQEATDKATLKRDGLISRRRAVKDLYNLSDEEADREVELILQDMVDEQAATSVSLPGQVPDEQLLGPEAGSTPRTPQRPLPPEPEAAEVEEPEQ